MTDEKVDEFLARWDKIAPSILIGYVGGISELAQILENRAIRIRPYMAEFIHHVEQQDRRRDEMKGRQKAGALFVRLY